MKPPQPVKIRSAGHHDAPFIAALSGEVFDQYGPYETVLPRWFLSGYAETLVALLDDRPVGFVMLGMNQGWEGSVRIAELLAIAVTPKHCHCGIGEQLMRAVLRLAETLGVEVLILHTGVLNLHAQTLFKRHGFTPVGIKDCFYEKGQSALMMKKEIIHPPSGPF